MYNLAVADLNFHTRSDETVTLEESTGNEAYRVALALMRGRGRPGRSGKNSYLTFCPAHENRRRRALSVGIGTNGKLLLHCFKECDFESIARSAAALGALPSRFQHDAKPSALVQRVINSMRVADWHYPGGVTDRVVLNVHVVIASRTNNVSEHEGSVTYVADKAGIRGIATVSRSHKRLRKAGWLTKVGRKPDGGGTLWRLRVPGDLRADRNGKNCFATRLRNFLPLRSAGHDVWIYGRGLGKTRLLIYDTLNAEIEISTAKLAMRLGYRDPRPVRNHLARLAKHGLSRRGLGGGWLRGNRPLDEVAKQLGINGDGEELRRRRQEAREEYRLRLAMSSRRTVSPRDLIPPRFATLQSRHPLVSPDPPVN